MADDDQPEDDDQSFRERVEEIRQEQADRDEAPQEPPGFGDMMGGGGGMGGNPLAQMMGGMMGGGPGGGGGGGAELDSERITREMGRLREEVRNVGDQLERIADSLEDD